MRGALLREAPGKLEIESELELDRLGRREVVIRTAAAGLCHSDLHYMEGRYRWPLPVVLGHESAGVVEAVGGDVRSVAPGDHVVTCLSLYCGRCEFCLTGSMALCDQTASVMRGRRDAPRISHRGERLAQFFELSSFAEQMLVHETAVVRIDPDLPLDRAAIVGCGVVTGLGAVFNTAEVRPGTTVAVIGCGGIGLSAIQGAAIAGANRIVAVDTVPAKLDVAVVMGATDTVDASAEDAVAAVRELSRGGVHYSFEAVGAKATVEQAYAMLRRGGLCTVVGMLPHDARVEVSGLDLLDEKRLQGSRMGSNRSHVDIVRYLDMYARGRLKLDELITERIPLEEINNGFDAMRDGSVGRTVVVF